MTVTEEIRVVAERAAVLDAVPLSKRDEAYERRRRRLVRRKMQLQKRIERGA